MVLAGYLIQYNFAVYSTVSDGECFYVSFLAVKTNLGIHTLTAQVFGVMVNPPDLPEGAQLLYTYPLPAGMHCQDSCKN